MNFLEKIIVFLLTCIMLILLASFVKQQKEYNDKMITFTSWIQTNFNAPQYEETSDSR